MNKLLIIFAGGLLLGGCATPVTLVPLKGNKAGGTITMSYDSPLFGAPAVVDWAKAEITAQKLCQEWGYQNAEKFGASEYVCQRGRNLYGRCRHEQVQITYQCTHKENSLNTKQENDNDQ